MLKNLLTSAAVVATLVLGASAASAQTTTTAASSTGTDTLSTPGAPNTGAGGAATENILLLVGSALAVIGGTGYLAKRTSAR